MTSFSVITPSFQQAHWLRLAIQSVADQNTDFPVEHLVQDSCSTDDTPALLAEFPHLRSFIEKDTGMYDAINRGLQRSTGEIVSYLNCDEQYLPGTLSEVARFFDSHPAVDFLFAGLVVVDRTGNYLCSRKVLPPLAAHTRVCHLSTFTCSTFFRRRVFEKHGAFFDTSWKAMGDAEWILRCLQKGLKMAAIPNLTSAFVDTGNNLGASATSEAERHRLLATAPRWQQTLIPAIATHHRLRRWLGGIYRQQPFAYSIYTPANPAKRTTFPVKNPSTIWKTRFTLLR